MKYDIFPFLKKQLFAGVLRNRFYRINKKSSQNLLEGTSLSFNKVAGSVCNFIKKETSARVLSGELC